MGKKQEKKNREQVKEDAGKSRRALNLGPFIVRAIAFKGAARRDLDKIKPLELHGCQEAVKRAEEYARYYQEHDVVTAWYCRKVAVLMELVDENTESGRTARNFMKSLLKEHWPDAYGYIEQAPEPVNFDKFCFLAARIKQQPARGARRGQSWDGDMPIFVYIANLLAKKMNYDTPEYTARFRELVIEEDRIKNNNTFNFTLSAAKEETAQELWRGIEKKFGGRVPETLNEYFASAVYKADKKNSPLFSFGNLAGLPLGALRHTFVNSLKVRQEVRCLVWNIPEEEPRITEELEEAALRIFTQALFLRAIATEYGRDRAYALKYIEMKNEEDRNINKKKFQALNSENEQLKKRVKALEWENRLLKEQNAYLEDSRAAGLRERATP